ncbi:hypothetical protein HF086_014404 [Spodoptera exigua]|uniref:Uncharacterized protein n=1 Tax=Spodoptera exigua TaxID=7107 RepID=A0A922MYD0_SPOEX|nr:hypothetical protein HF086_014404 [Spodoptera exigua]
MSCFNSLVDMEVLQQEIENAKPTGEVDEVFKKYCAKTPQFKNCFRNMTEMVKPCFSPAEQKNFNVMYNVTEQLADFICFKEGDRIALFIAEGGKECFQDQQDGIQECFSTVFDNKTQANIQNISVSGIMELEFKKCMVSTLEKCPKPTSANILDSLFNFIRKATPCKQFIKEEKKGAPGSATGLAVTATTLLTALVVSILV